RSSPSAAARPWARASTSATPELARARLDALELNIEWMGLPTSLVTHYANYPASVDPSALQVELALIEDASAQIIAADSRSSSKRVRSTDPLRTLVYDPLPALVGYERRLDIEASADLRSATRHLRLELRGSDFGHAIYPSTAASLASLLAIKLATNTLLEEQGSTVESEAPKYRVNPPYTPTIKQLSVDYGTSLHLEVAAPGAVDELLHIHPFGTTPLGPDAQSLFPRHANAGELYIGLRDVAAPQNLSLLIQLAEGTSDPELDPAIVEWSYLDANRWVDCDVVFDSTRGLLNSGIVELQLPPVEPSTRLPANLHWLRVAVARNVESVCDTVAIRTQAVTVQLVDRGNAAAHFEQPLPVGSITRLVKPDARIAAIEQPFTSFGGKPPERPEHLYTRVSERLRHKQRALTAWDYERLVLDRFSQIYKIKCFSGDEPGRVEVIVIPDIRNALPGDPFAPKASTNLLADIQEYLPCARRRWPGSGSATPAMSRCSCA
ncbi:MAG: hypothetical protein HC927_03375, partial [Deltaproteobacteria bacterium]|nr:hypothetical protein [Deltaproteobacteria bacterium]